MTTVLRTRIPRGSGGIRRRRSIVRDARRSDGGAPRARHTLDYAFRNSRRRTWTRATSPIDRTEPAGVARPKCRRTAKGITKPRVICAAFAGKRSLQRHQMVYGTLGSRVGREIHALALTTLTPEEAQAPSA